MARFIRVQPIRFHGYIALRMEFYGCRSGMWHSLCKVCGLHTDLYQTDLPLGIVDLNNLRPINDTAHYTYYHLYIRSVYDFHNRNEMTRPNPCFTNHYGTASSRFFVFRGFCCCCCLVFFFGFFFQINTPVRCKIE